MGHGESGSDLRAALAAAAVRRAASTEQI
ncbi:MAG: hypothetical protein JWQ60_5221, partial [Pseudonocardia sp.]|nr:hypothetical protein [Pseudonocardia sp.]